MKLTKVMLAMLAVVLLAIPAAAQAPAPAADPIKTLVAEWQRAKLGTQEYIDAMPDDGISSKPSPQIRSFAEQFLHVAAANYMFAGAVAGVEPPYTGVVKEKNPEFMPQFKESKAALREFVLGSYDYVIQTIQKLDAAKLNEEVSLFRFKMPRALMFNKALEHHAHHRGQTTIYLRLKGVTPPSERLF